MTTNRVSALLLVLTACSSGGGTSPDNIGADGGSGGNTSSGGGTSGTGSSSGNGTSSGTGSSSGSSGSSSTGSSTGSSGGSSGGGDAGGGHGPDGGNSSSGVADAGGDVVSVAADAGIAVPADYKGTPFGGTAQTIPGVISAYKYDVGRNNVAFDYGGTINACAQRTAADCIGISTFGGGQVTTTDMVEPATQVYVGWTQTGEWINYTVQVTEAGTYAIGAHVSAAMTGAQVTFSFSPNVTTGPLTVPTTAGYVTGVEAYHVWERLDSLATVTLPAGLTVLTFKIDAVAGMNIESFTFTKQ